MSLIQFENLPSTNTAVNANNLNNNFNELNNDNSVYQSAMNDNNPAWIKLFNITFSSHRQGNFACAKIMIGDGNNSRSDQNACIDLYMQLGWDGDASGGIFGCVAELKPYATSFTKENVYLKIIANSPTNYDVWLYTSRNFCAPNLLVYVDKSIATVTKFSNVIQTTAPSGTECQLEYFLYNEETDWTDCTLTNNYSHSQWSHLKYKKKNGIVTIVGTVDVNNGTYWGDIITTLPVGFRPVGEFDIVCRTSVWQVMKIAITTSGEIQPLELNDGTQLPANSGIFISATYVV